MLETLPVALAVGTALGFLSGLGIGGGSLLILYLTLALQVEPAAARLVNLMFFLPCAAISCIFRWKQGALKMKTILPAIIAGCVAAAAFSFARHLIDTALLKKLFGVLLLCTGLREVFYRKK